MTSFHPLTGTRAQKKKLAWRVSNTEQGGRAESRDNLRLEHFVPMETYDSMQRCYYGFVPMIKLWGRAAALSLTKSTKTAVSFILISATHVHAACGNARHLMQSNANACALTSHLKMSIKASAHGNVTLMNKK
jgi:hypothetical protein